ncbi:MAG: outer membrane beta-barrel protein [Bacteroidota bacterium]|nr:outer membrane beta-barrel protein [Bacteroidota bacterium]
MKQFLTIAMIFVFAAGSAVAQQDTQEKETKIVIENKREKRHNYLTVRFGAWFPKDEENAFNYNNNVFDETDALVDESQALGLDFHFRRNVGRPLFFDVSASAWYTTTEFNFDRLVENPDELRSADTWTVIVPITLGLSFAPLPDNPLQPYAMAGAGAYLGFTGRDVLRVSNQNEPDDTETYVRFGFYLGAGMDILFSDEFGVSLGLKYQFVEFDEGQLFTGQADMTGLQATIGFVLGS